MSFARCAVTLVVMMMWVRGGMTTACVRRRGLAAMVVGSSSLGSQLVLALLQSFATLLQCPFYLGLKLEHPAGRSLTECSL